MLSDALAAVGATTTTEVADAYVVVVGGSGGPAGELAAMDPERWADGVERPLSKLLVALQAAYVALVRRGGSIVVVLPTIGIPGATSLVDLTTLVEGARAMAKSAARQWASEQISVNMVAVPLGLLEPTLEELTSHLLPPVGGCPEPADIGHAIGAFLDTGLALTGSTLVVDGGSVMAP